MRINFYTNVTNSQIKKQSDDEYVIQAVPMTIDNAVMNQIFYPADENAKGLKSYIGKPVAITHPFDEDGRPTTAMSGSGLYDNYSGGIISNAYNHEGVNYADIKIKMGVLESQKDGMYFANKIRNKESIGVSTGLYFSGNEQGGICKNGDSYIMTAINQEGDHLAMLKDDEKPAGGDATFIRFNGENDNQQMCVNIDDFIAQMTTNEKTLFDKFVAFMQKVATSHKNTDNTHVTNKNIEVDTMRETLIQALQAKGISVNADISDAELLTKYNESNTPDIAAVINAAVQPLTEQLKQVSTELAANKDKELDGLASQVAEILDIDESEAKAMGSNAMHKVLAKNGVQVGAPNAFNHQSPRDNASKTSINAKPWEAK